MKINTIWTFKNIEHLYGDNCEDLLFSFLELYKKADPCCIYQWKPGVLFQLDVSNISNDECLDYCEIEFEFYFSFTKSSKLPNQK